MGAMPLRTVVLLVLAVPVAIAGYWIATQLVLAMSLPEGLRSIALLFLPLLAAGLCALPLIAPAFDHLAKQALDNKPPDGPQPDERPGR